MLPFERWRHRRVWKDPQRKLRTLESFGETEEDGGRDLEAAARRVGDAKLREHLKRHARDERRHAALFRQRAGELKAQLALAARDSGEADQAYDLSRGRRGHEVDAHGFFRAGLCDELGEVAYVAMLHVAEVRAAQVFRLHRGLVSDDPALCATLDEILVDEKYHVAYTERILEGWDAEGRGAEVRRGLADARASRFLGAWKRLGVRSASGFSRALLFVLYWTLLMPFGIVARLSSSGPVVRDLREHEPLRSLARQS
jgi:hypothetical protein